MTERVVTVRLEWKRITREPPHYELMAGEIIVGGVWQLMSGTWMAERYICGCRLRYKHPTEAEARAAVLTAAIRALKDKADD